MVGRVSAERPWFSSPRLGKALFISRSIVRRSSLGRLFVPRSAFLCLAVLSAAFAAAPASAGELFGGLYVHDVKLPTDESGIENGMDIQVGYRGGGIAMTPLQPYIFGALNTAGETNYAAVGLSAKFGHSIYIRPGLGIAIQTGSAGKFFNPDRIAFG